MSLKRFFSTNSAEVNDIKTKRAVWGNQREFLLSCVGYTVGLGNIWRFPYLAYNSGGGAFLIPYITMLITCGMPMYIMEVALGQYIAEGPIQVWRIVCPLFRGIGYSMLMVSFLVSVYYNVIIAWVLFYLFASFRSNVPWSRCDPSWATELCLEGAKPTKIGNGTLYNLTTGETNCQRGLLPRYNETFLLSCELKHQAKELNYPSVEYFSNYVLQSTYSINEFGGIRWEIVLCLLLAWVVVYFCMWKGVQSAGKVVYFTATFPYVILIILLIRGLTLEHAIQGVVFYAKPDFKKILNPTVWASAGGQLFYSLGPAFGSLLSFASYNRFHNNCIRDSMFISVMDAVTSSLAGLVIFSVLGSMAGKLNINVDDVATGGPGLAFMVYPEGIAQMPLSSFWSILFFFMLFTLGLDSQFGMMECVVTNLADEYPRYLRKNKEIFISIVCAICFLFGLIMCTRSGIYWFTVFDYQSAGVCLIFVAFIEVVVVGWFFDADRLIDIIEKMVGYRPSIWWKICWKFLSPIVLATVLVFQFINWSGISYDGKQFPSWTEVVGWLLSMATASMIPIFSIMTLYQSNGKTFLEKLKLSLQPDVKTLAQKLAAHEKQDEIDASSNDGDPFVNDTSSPILTRSV